MSEISIWTQTFLITLMIKMTCSTFILLYSSTLLLYVNYWLIYVYFNFNFCTTWFKLLKNVSNTILNNPTFKKCTTHPVTPLWSTTEKPFPAVCPTLWDLSLFCLSGSLHTALKQQVEIDFESAESRLCQK